MMKKKQYFWIAPVLAIVIILSGIPMTAHATEVSAAQPAGEMVDVPLFSRPQSMRLPHNTASFWFMIPNGTRLGDKCGMTLRMAVTGTLDSDRSSVTLLVNDVQISSAPLLDVMNNENGSWTVSIPAQRLKTDGTLNELRIVTAQRSILGDCADIDNPSNWVTLKESSRLHLDVLSMGEPELGTSVPYFFNRVDQGNQISAEFVLPSREDQSSRSSMLTIASGIGASYPSKDKIDFTVSQGAAAGQKANRIFVGYGSLQPQSSAAVPSLSQNQGYLAVSRTNAGNDLVVSGADAEGLAKATAFFTSLKDLAQLSGKSAVISTDLRGRAAQGFSKREDGFYTLSDFGYDTMNLAGAFHQQTAYTLKQPEAIRSGGDSYVEIHFRHSKALVADSSLLTVLINDVAVNSIQLSDSNADKGTIKAKIPADALDGSTIRVRVECYNYLGKIDCSKDYYDTAWTVIDKNSVVYFEPGDAGIPPTAAQFPLFDPQASDSAGMAILAMPADASKSLWEAAGTLSCRAGQNAGAAYRWETAADLESAPDKATSDILILGSNDKVRIPQDIAKQLQAVPKGNGGFTIAESASVTGEALRNKIVVQAIRSPWNFSKKVYVLTYPSNMEDQLKRFASARGTMDTLSGEMALIDSHNRVTAIGGTSAENTEQLPLTADRVIGKIVRATGISRVGLLVIGVCILIILLLIVKVLRNRKRFDDARHKMEKINSNVGREQTDKETNNDGDGGNSQ